MADVAVALSMVVRSLVRYVILCYVLKTHLFTLPKLSTTGLVTPSPPLRPPLHIVLIVESETTTSFVIVIVIVIDVEFDFYMDFMDAIHQTLEVEVCLTGVLHGGL